MSGRLNQEREAELQPKRLESCRTKLEELGFTVKQIDHSEIDFEFQGHTIKLYPYSGWFTGKGVGSGRGFKNLLRKIEVKS